MRVDNGKEFCAKHCANCFINSTLFTSKNHHMGAKKRPEKLSESPLLPSGRAHTRLPGQLLPGAAPAPHA